MTDTKQLYQNAIDGVRTLQRQIDQTVYDGEQSFTVFQLGNELISLCLDGVDFTLTSLYMLQSFNDVCLEHPDKEAKARALIEDFYNSYIKPIQSKNEG